MSSKPHTPNLDPPATTPSLSPHPSPDSTMDALLSAVDEILSRSEALLPMVERLKPIIHALEPLQAEDVPVRKVVESLYAELRLLRTLCKNGSSGGLVEDSVHNLGKWLDQLTAVWTDAPSEVREGMDLLRRDMMDAQFGEWSSSAESGGGIVPDVEDLVLRVKKEEDEELGVALLELGLLVRKGMVGEQGGSLIGVLLNRLGNVKNDNRWRMLVLLRRLAMRSEADKEKMSGIEALSSIVRSLTRDVGESREAVGLLMDLSVISKVRQRIGRVQGCIMMLVTLLNGDDPCASDDAGKLLCALSSNTQNVLLMAEAGYFVPLVQYLKEGSDMNKILMATAISRIELTDQMKRALGEEGSIEPLVKMFTLGKLEAKLSALGALRHLSSLTENIPRLIKSGILESLLQLLFSVTSVLMTLREPAAAILASLAQSDQILIHKDVTQQMLSLLNLSSPAIQFHLLQALNSIASHSNAKRAKAKMKENGAVQLLLPFLIESNAGIRTVSLNLLFNLSKDFAGELTELLGDTHLNILVGIISSSTSETEKAAAVGILSNLPVKDKKATDILIRANLLSLLINLVGASVTTNQTPTRSLLLESIASVMIRFTVPWDKKLQKASAAVGIIPCLIKLLSGDSAVAKSRSATSLAQLSQNTLVLSKAKSSGWLCVPPSSEAFCEVHNGYCGVKSTFCLLKSGAVSPLLRILEGKDREADEAVLSALATLMQDEIWENGSNSIEKASGVQTIIRVVEVGSLKAQEKAVWMLERIFRIGTHKVKYGGAAQILLIDLAQKGDPTLKPMIAKTLAHLQLLQMQSSYF